MRVLMCIAIWAALMLYSFLYGAYHFYTSGIEPYVTVTEEDCLLSKPSGAVCKMNVEWVVVEE